MGTGTLTNGNKTKTLNVYNLLQDMKEILDSIPPEPIGEWMKEKGFDPEKGYGLLLPVSYKELLGPFPPHYVKCSPNITEPCIWLIPSLYNHFNLKDLYEDTRPNFL